MQRLAFAPAQEADLLNKQGTDLSVNKVRKWATARIGNAGKYGGAHAAKDEARIVADELRQFSKDSGGFISLGPALAVVGTVLGLIVLVLVVAALAGDFFNATSDITTEFSNSGLTGTAGVVAGVVAILIPIALLFALATIVLKKVG